MSTDSTSQERYEAIMAQFDRGGKIMTMSYSRCTQYTAAHRAMFFVQGADLMVRRGKHAECLNLTPIKFSVLA